QHLLPQELVKRLPEEVLEIKPAIAANRSIRREGNFGIASASCDIAPGAVRTTAVRQRRTVGLRIFPFDQQPMPLARMIELQEGVGAGGVGAALHRTAIDLLVEVVACSG